MHLYWIRTNYIYGLLHIWIFLTQLFSLIMTSERCRIISQFWQFRLYHLYFTIELLNNCKINKDQVFQKTFWIKRVLIYDTSVPWVVFFALVVKTSQLLEDPAKGGKIRRYHKKDLCEPSYHQRKGKMELTRWNWLDKQKKNRNIYLQTGS